MSLLKKVGLKKEIYEQYTVQIMLIAHYVMNLYPNFYVINIHHYLNEGRIIVINLRTWFIRILLSQLIVFPLNDKNTIFKHFSIAQG